jgi:hypothetical protein
LIDPRVQVKTIISDSLLTDWNLNEIRAHFLIETVGVHPQVEGGVPQPDQSWKDVSAHLELPTESLFEIMEKKHAPHGACFFPGC